jgi:hypothetical protein
LANKKIQKSLTFIVLNILLVGITPRTNAGVGTSLMQTANVLEPGTFQGKIQGDLIFNRGGGFNISPHLGFGIIEHFVDLDTYVGTGTTDFQVGALAKYNLFPDIPEQVGVALNLGLGFQRDSIRIGPDVRLPINSVLFTFGILASKEMTTDFGSMAPYGSFQFEGLVRNQNQPSTVPLSLILGSAWKFKEINWGFFSEANVNVNESFWALSLGSSYTF